VELVAGDDGVDADGPLAVTLGVDNDDLSWSWSVTNDSSRAVSCRSVWRTFRVEAEGPVSMFVNGWQTWSPTGWRTAGVDADPSTGGPHPALLRWCHHADPDPARPGELRSELVTVLADSTGRLAMGAVGGDRHDTTFRLLDAWASTCGAAAAARNAAPFTTGWCSWYQYYAAVTESDIRRNLAASSAEWGFDVFQVDDGFQPAIGDWLATDVERFPSPLDALAADIRAAGSTPGLWLAPFLAAPASETARRHPHWFARHRGASGDRPLVGQLTAAWGGEVWVLDTTLPEVQSHLEGLGRDLVAAGFPYLKLDFTYAPALPGVYADPTYTPAERVRAGFDAFRRGAGDEAFVLGCGAPLGPVVGVVDGCRIGPDVAPWWRVRAWPVEGDGYRGTAPSTANALASTVARQPFHRHLWLNDPDCLLLRPTDTSLTEAERRAWAAAIALSGGMVLLSDELARLGAAERDLWKGTVAAAREVDARTRV